MKSLLLRLLLLLGIAVNVGFLLINLSPDRPHLAGLKKVRVLVRASPWRAKWMKENMFDEFGAAQDLDIEPVIAKSFDEVLAILEAEKDKPTGLLLADINDESADELRKRGTVLAMQDLVTPAVLAAAVAEYEPEPIRRASEGGKVWFLPKRALVDVAAWLRPAVEDLFLHWEKDRPAIEAALREANARGLPRSYQLEKTPAAWDSFDLFVAGWYWAHHPAPWAAPGDTAPAPRLGWRTGDKENAIDDLLGAFYRHGLKDEEIESIDAPAVLDALQWLALFRKHHLVAAVTEKPEGADAPAINQLLKKRALGWAPIDQADSLWVHGGSRRDSEPGMINENDLDWADLPAGNSVTLDPQTGEPERTGRSFSLEQVHFWAVPVHSPHPKLAWELARFITQKGLQQRETEAVGLLPVRADLAQDYPILFRLNWMQRMLDASYRQLQRGSGDLPDVVSEKHLDKVYAALVTDVLAGTPPVTLAGVQQRVAKFKAARKLAEVQRGN